MAQLVAQWSPKPPVPGSSPGTRAMKLSVKWIMTVESILEGMPKESPESDLPKNQQEWLTWLSENLESFDGSLTNASLLMTHFVEGLNYIIKTLTSRGLRIECLPDLVIPFKIAEHLPPIGYNLDDKEIYVVKTFLELASRLNMEKMETAYTRNNEVGFKGTPPDIFLLAGVEEAYHAVFTQYKDHGHQEDLSGDCSLAEYTAQEDEYRALKWQIRFARDHNMPAETQKILQEELEQSRALRSARKSSTSCQTLTPF